MKFLIYNLQFSKLPAIISLAFLFLSFSPQTQAAGLVPCGTEWDRTVTPPRLLNPCQFCHVFVLTNNVARFFLVPDVSLNNKIPIVPAVATLMFIIGGFYMLIAGGRPELFNKAKAIITATVIGLIIVFISWALLNTIFDALGLVNWAKQQSPFSPDFWTVTCPTLP